MNNWEIVARGEGAYDRYVIGVWTDDRPVEKASFGAVQGFGGWTGWGKWPDDFDPADEWDR